MRAMPKTIERTPIEQAFASICLTGIHDSWKVLEQPTITVRRRKRRPDFLIENNVVAYWIECDGKDFHDFTGDREKDWDVLTAIEMKSVIRFRGCDLHYNANLCRGIFAAAAPDIFLPGQHFDMLSILGIVKSVKDIFPIIRFAIPKNDKSKIQLIQKTAVAVRDGYFLCEVKSDYWRR